MTEENPGDLDRDRGATCNRFLGDMGIGLGPYAQDGTAAYLHDDKLHPNNPVALSEAGK